MGKRDFTPLRVHDAATLLMQVKGTAARTPPRWLRVMNDVPPSEPMVRTQPVQHNPPRRFGKIKKASRLFQPQHIRYEEDELRQEFFTDHPWELARPRVLLENDGKDSQRWDWSKPDQSGRPLNGESVVQRQLYLMQQQGYRKAQAYDQARKEFYELRHQEEVEQHVAREEALSTGAVFGMSAIEVGMELENKSFENWKAYAQQQVILQEQARSAAYSGVGGQSGTEEEDSSSTGMDAVLDELEPDAAAAQLNPYPRGHSLKRLETTYRIHVHAMIVFGATVVAAALSCLGLVQADKTAADYYVHSLPGAPPGPLLKMHAGHIEVAPEHHGNLFFWHYQNRHIGDRQRTVIWLNGGPGCSSMDGALMEIGPYRVRAGGTLEYNVGSWDEFANVLFVDNPVGTGFSYVDTNSYLHELQEMADNFITFLEKWFAIFPEYEHDDLYIAGESYAGQHIPYIAKAILDHNKDTTKQAWSLTGLLIGNGWISPVDQYPAYLEFAYKSGLVQGGSDMALTLEAQAAVCTKAIANGGKDRVDTPECEGILQDILRLTNNPSKYGGDQSCVNMYDVRLRDSYPSCGMNWPPDLEHVTPYLRRSDVIQALHVNPDKTSGWTECNGAVGSAFRAQHSRPSITLLPEILASVRVMLFSGDRDLICNHVGTEELIHNLAWGGGRGFELSPGTWAPKRAWTFEDEPAGIYQAARNLTYVVFYNSSHMVPFDYPRRTRDMLDRFMGVDIASIGGAPTDSRIDGEKAGLETSVGGHPNSTVAEADEADKLQQATWRAYYRAGEVALVIVATAAAAWGYFVWKDRRRRAGYGGLGHAGGGAGGMGGMLDSMGFRMKSGRPDLEAADFDEAELDKLEPPARDGAGASRAGPAKEGRYDAASDEESEDEGDVVRGSGR